MDIVKKAGIKMQCHIMPILLCLYVRMVIRIRYVGIEYTKIIIILYCISQVSFSKNPILTHNY